MAPKEVVECVAKNDEPFPFVGLRSVEVEVFLTGQGSAKTRSTDSGILGNSPLSISCASTFSTSSGDSATVLGFSTPLGDDHSGQSQERAFLMAEGPSSCIAEDGDVVEDNGGGGLFAPA